MSRRVESDLADRVERALTVANHMMSDELDRLVGIPVDLEEFQRRRDWYFLDALRRLAG
jgi:hypothetical protein